MYIIENSLGHAFFKAKNFTRARRIYGSTLKFSSVKELRRVVLPRDLSHKVIEAVLVTKSI